MRYLTNMVLNDKIYLKKCDGYCIVFEAHLFDFGLQTEVVTPYDPTQTIFGQT